MGTSNVRFFLPMRTIFSICRMLIALVHFLYEAAARYISYYLGHGLHASNALSHHRASGHGASPTVVFYTSRRKQLCSVPYVPLASISRSARV
jgi:hypothetical protein